MTHTADDPDARGPETGKSQESAGSSATPADAGAAEDSGDEGGWSQRITTTILLLAMFGLAVEVGIWAWNRLSAYGPGDAFPPVETVSLEDGAPGTWMPATGGRAPATLLMLLTTTCPMCQGNVPGWNSLHDAVSSEVRVTGLSLDPADKTARFVDALGVRFPVEAVADPEAFKEEIALPGVPLTLLLDAEGGLVEYWYGPVNSEVRRQIQERVVELVPELSPQSSNSTTTSSIEPTASRRHGPHRAGHPTPRLLLGLST